MTSARGDQFSELLRPHLDKLYRLAFRLTSARADAEDLVQDVLTKLYGRRDELSSIENLAPWLGRVLYNQFVDDSRRYRRQRLHVVNEHNLIDTAVAGGRENPDTAAHRSENVTALTNALDKLSEEHRVVVLLHDAEGYSLPEIQTLTDVPLGTLKSRLHRARARLRDLLEKSGTLSDAQTFRYSEGARIDAV
jgi:RNA polymerase sigma-70 factor (ECF subfamily)